MVISELTWDVLVKMTSAQLELIVADVDIYIIYIYIYIYKILKTRKEVVFYAFLKDILKPTANTCLLMIKMKI